jgi:hypothetical protein
LNTGPASTTERTAPAVTDLAIPAIPTRYAGVLFRSRTEARWARFWDALDIRWDYEPQGFVTAAGDPYLPDFAVFPALGLLWAEIKGSWQSDPEGVAKWRGFAMQRPQPAVSRAVLLSGTPSIGGAFLVIGGDDDSPDPLKGGWEDDTQQWRPCSGGHHFDLAYPGTFGAKFVEDGCDWDIGPGDDRLRKAVEAALSARFGTYEHGETAA